MFSKLVPADTAGAAVLVRPVSLGDYPWKPNPSSTKGHVTGASDSGKSHLASTPSYTAVPIACDSDFRIIRDPQQRSKWSQEFLQTTIAGEAILLTLLQVELEDFVFGCSLDSPSSLEKMRFKKKSP